MVADTHKRPESSSPEDDALKRSTDCVYFLASPLTCKKGSECEYRHSEYARVNPRDCWFWLNSNCLNPKCTFRHPPLDGLLSTQVDIPVRSLIASVKPALSAATQVNCTTSKQAVPCIFFQKGMCFKGDRCAFLHGPIPISNKGPQAPTAPSVTERPSFKRSFGGLEKCTQEQKISQSSMSKPIEIPSTPKPTGVPPSLKPARKTETAPIKNGVSVLKHLPHGTAIDTEMRCVRSTVPAVVNGSSISRANHIHQSSVSNDCSFQTDKDAEERLRGSFAGFGVLVDKPGQYGRKRRGHEDQYDNAHSEDYSSTVEIDRERLHDPRTFDSYEHMQGKYAHVERGSYPKAENPDQTNESDLRRHLLKEKRVSGLRSVVTCDYGRDRHTGEQSYLPPKESSLSSRFRGRLNLSRKFSSIDGTDLRIERGRNGKPQMSSQTGRIRDRITGVVEGDFINKGKGFRASQIDRDIMDDKGFDFAAPKSLSELKEGKISQSKTQSFSSGRQRNINESEGDLLFEGPKPLSAILKRKREAELCDNNKHSNKKERVESLPHSFKAESVNAFHSQPETTMNGGFVDNDEEEINSASSELPTVNVLESDNDVRLHEMEDQELEAYDRRDGDYDDANGEYAEEYLEEDDDEDDFAKKIGIILT